MPDASQKTAAGAASSPGAETVALNVGQPPSRIYRLRWVICGMLFFASANNYLDRQALGVLAPALINDLGWSAADYAGVVFWFQLGFAIGFPLTGRFLDLAGSRRGYAAVVLLWSAATAWQSVTGSPAMLKAARFFLGINQSGNMPAGVKALTECFSPKERSLAMGVFKSGSNLGAIAAPLLIPWLYFQYGWRTTFFAIATSGLLWAVLWWWLYRDPQTPKTANAPKRTSWRLLLGRRETWAYMNFKFMTDAVWHWYLAMLPLFLHQHFGLELKQFGLPLIIVYMIGSIGSIGGGWISTHWIGRGWDLTRARKTSMLICCACTIPVMLVTQLSNLWICVCLIGLAHAAHQGLNSNLFSVVSDIFPQQAVGSVVGLGGCAAQIGAALMMLGTSHVLESKGHLTGLFFVAGAAYIVAFFIFHFLVPKLTPLELSERKAY